MSTPSSHGAISLALRRTKTALLVCAGVTVDRWAGGGDSDWWEGGGDSDQWEGGGDSD